MRPRTSAALVLVMALVASPVAALACGFDCGPGLPPSSPVETVETVESVEAPPAVGTCHRAAEASVDSRFTLSAAPHDCSSHSGVATDLTGPRSSSLPSAGVASHATLPSVVGDAFGAAAARLGRDATRDLAPPGRTPDLIAPLRI